LQFLITVPGLGQHFKRESKLVVDCVFCSHR